MARKDLRHDGFALFTDLYELTMLQAYFQEGLTEDAVFSLFVRRLPARRNFLLACGLGSVLEYLEGLNFSENDLEYLASLDKFTNSFLDWLRDFHFTGEVYAVPEGTPIFANEPILEIKAPILQAQLLETFIMNQIHVQTLLATKAQRVITAARGLPVVDFGARRMHGIDAALKAARAFYVGGVTSTSNLLAGKEYGLPVSGTMAHSYIQVHQDEKEAFKKFAELYPGTILLVDTYDTLAGVQKVCDLALELGKKIKIKGIRLDSGDLISLSKKARRLLDKSGLKDLEIFVSGGLNEDKVAELLSAEAPIDGFGIGTSMGVSNDVPSLDIAYKLCEYAGKGRLKLSAGKAILPGRKQVFRMNDDKIFTRDVIARAEEEMPGKPLLVKVMDKGRRLSAGKVELEYLRDYAKKQILLFPERIRLLKQANPPYTVQISKAMSLYQKQVKEEVAQF